MTPSDAKTREFAVGAISMVRFRSLLWSLFLFFAFVLCRADSPCTKGQHEERWPLYTSEEPSNGPTKWMSQMRERGIKVAGVEAAVLWNEGVDDISITDIRYYSSYSRSGTIAGGATSDSDDLSKALAETSSAIIARQLQKLMPSQLSKLGLNRARGHMLIFLYDDPCFPIRVRLTGITDPDVTPLIRWASIGNFEHVSSLLHTGQDPNGHSQREWTALMAASLAGSVDVVRLLLENGARVNDRDMNGRTALHYAVERPEASVVIPLLLAAGAEIDGKMSPTAPRLPGATPLIVSASVGNSAAVRILLNGGADPNALTSDRMTALDVARHPPIIARAGHAEVIKLLENSSDENAHPR